MEACVQVTKIENETPLVQAILAQEFDTVQQLVKNGSDVNKKGLFGYTPLMEAAREGQENVVSFLVENGANVNLETKETEETALSIASSSGHLNIVKYLISRGADIESGGCTALMDAAMEGQLETVLHFLRNTNAVINARTVAGSTALSFACENGSLEVVNALLEYGAEVDIEASNGQTPLMISCARGTMDITRKLIECKANIHHVSRINETPLSVACMNGQPRTLEYLIELGADVDNVSVDGKTPLMHACLKGCLDSVKILLAKNVDVNWMPESKKFNALSMACFGGHVEVVMHLLKKTNVDPFKRLFDNSDMLKETIKGGTLRKKNDPHMMKIVKIFLDYPNSIVDAEDPEGEEAETAV